MAQLCKLRIAIDTRGSEAFKNFIYQSFSRIIPQNPHHKFIFFFDKETPFKPEPSNNVIAESVLSGFPLSILSKKHTIAFLLKKHHADILVSTRCSSKVHIPKFLIYDNKELSAKCLKPLKKIVTASERVKNELVLKYQLDESKLVVVYPGIDAFYKPFSIQDKEKTKEKYADGQEYFFYYGALKYELILNLLKAFSGFKKRQKSNMKLILASQNTASTDLIKNLHSFRFKDDVTILENIQKEDKKKLIASAYATICFSGLQISDFFPHQSMQSNVPAIISFNKDVQEYCGEAALCVKHGDVKDIAEKMMLIYKDEKLRNEMIDLGQKQVQKYSWDKTAEQFWSVLNAVS